MTEAILGFYMITASVMKGLNYNNIMHEIPDLVFQSVYLFNMNLANLCLFKVNN